MPNAWIEHVKDFANRTGKSYGCAISDPDCKASYVKPPRKARTPKQPKESKARAPRKPRTPKQPKSIQERLQERIEKIQSSGSKPFTQGQQQIKDRLLYRILKNRMDRGL
jgi:hypothetical protein